MDYIIPFLVANFVANNNLWVGDLTINQESEEVYFEWRKKLSRIFTSAREDMTNIREFLSARNLHFDDLFAIKEGEQPIIFRLLVQRYISLETYIIMDIALNFGVRFDKRLHYDPIYERWGLKIRKYKPFLRLDQEKCLEEVKNVFVRNT